MLNHSREVSEVTFMGKKCLFSNLTCVAVLEGTHKPVNVKGFPTKTNKYILKENYQLERDY